MLIGCGRFGFEEGARISDSGARNDGNDSALATADGSEPEPPTIDAASDASGMQCQPADGVCLLACVGSDSDCVTTCGDGRCVGNSGESCNNCAADCDTVSPVCGNGACTAGEIPDCYADCGPAPWPWTADEATILSRLNAARTGAYDCPGPPTPAVAPLTASASIQPGSREWAWDIAHNLNTTDNSCNGRSMPVRVMNAGGSVVWYVFHMTADANQAVDFWLADGQACQSIMNGSWTTVGIGAARDMINGYVIMMN